MRYTFLNINVNGVISVIPEIHELLATHRPIVVVLTDTRLKEAPWFYFQGYQLYHAPTQDRAGGVIILIRTDIPNRLATSPFNSQPPFWYSLSVEIYLQSPLIITGVYRRPNNVIQPFITQFPQYICRKSHIVIGDLNAKHPLWGNKSSNVLGNWLAQQNISVITPDTFTFAINNRFSTIDVLLTHRPELFDAVTTFPPLSTSDHLPVLYHINTMPDIKKQKHQHYNYSLAKWKSYQEYIFSHLPSPKYLNTEQDLNNAIDTLTTTIRESAHKFIPTYEPRPPFLRKLPKHISQLISTRHTILNRYRRTKQEILRPVLRSLTRQIFNLRRKWLSSIWHDKLRSVHADPKKFWTLVRSAHSKYQRCGITKGTDLAPPSVQAQILTDHIIPGRPYQTNLMEAAPAPLIIPKLLRSILRSMKGKKSAGPDGIQAILLQKLPRKGFAHLLQIYNCCFRLNIFPTRWQTAIMTPLLKPGKDPTVPSSYRPISLLDHMGKLLEKVIRHYLQQHVDSNNVLPPTQAGFRAAHSTVTQLARITNDVHAALGEERATCMVSVDCKEAFPSVSHLKLLAELRRYYTPPWIVNIIATFLQHRQASFRVISSIATPKHIYMGLPQGAVLSPLLFNIYTAHLLTTIDPEISIAAYADDIALYFSHQNPNVAVYRIEGALEQLSLSLEQYNISINPDKTDGLIFSYHSKYKRPTQFKLRTRNIPFSNYIKYLGITLDKHLTYSLHIKNNIEKLRRRVKLLYKLLRSNNISIRLKLLIFKMVIRPALLYGSPLYRELYKSLLIKLQQFENRLLRTIAFNTSLQRTYIRNIRNTWNVTTVKTFITQNYIKFYDNMQHMSSPLFSIVRPPTRTIWHNSRMIDITEQPTDHLYR